MLGLVSRGQAFNYEFSTGPSRLCSNSFFQKTSMSVKLKFADLAIMGGEAIFESPLHVNQPWVADQSSLFKLTNLIWQARQFSNNGPLALELEKKIADRLGVNHFVLMSNGTMAMRLLLKALKLQGEVILPSFTFISTAHVLLDQGLTPVFCDVNLDDGNLSVEHCRNLITANTCAIIPTHLWGNPCDIESLEILANEKNLSLVFDAAHAFGCSYNGRQIGSLGDAEVFSFHATKAFHCGEGGGIACSDDQLAEKLRKLRNFGFAGYDHVVEWGTNAKLPELSAALGLINLDSFDENTKLNQKIYERYAKHLSHNPYLEFFKSSQVESHNRWYVALKLSEDCPVKRDRLVEVLHAENILARRYFYPGCHLMEPYKRQYPEAHSQLPTTHRLAAQSIQLPGGSSVQESDVDKICELIEFVFSHAKEFHDCETIGLRT